MTTRRVVDHLLTYLTFAVAKLLSRATQTVRQAAMHRPRCRLIQRLQLGIPPNCQFGSGQSVPECAVDEPANSYKSCVTAGGWIQSSLWLGGEGGCYCAWLPCNWSHLQQVSGFGKSSRPPDAISVMQTLWPTSRFGVSKMMWHNGRDVVGPTRPDGVVAVMPTGHDSSRVSTS